MVLLEAQVIDVELLFDPLSFLLQDKINNRREIKSMRNKPTDFRECLIKYNLFSAKIKISL